MDVYLHTLIAVGSMFAAFCFGYYYGAKAIIIAAARDNHKVTDIIKRMKD